ncbi:hypothetical protein, partial [Faecalibaculum rodentium]|uniref:hypothetical protein n=1 Tax=Faecalibaculum rodentium TaxID=1702221 RepID=UPI002675D38C
ALFMRDKPLTELGSLSSLDNSILMIPLYANPGCFDITSRLQRCLDKASLKLARPIYLSNYLTAGKKNPG